MRISIFIIDYNFMLMKNILLIQIFLLCLCFDKNNYISCYKLIEQNDVTFSQKNGLHNHHHHKISHYEEEILFPGCSNPPKKRYTRDIIKGKPINKYQYPWLVSILSPEIEPNNAYCIGSILNSEWILTAAHCYSDAIQHDKIVNIKAGQHEHGPSGDITEGVQEFRVKRIVLHENFNQSVNPKSINDDIALFKVHPPIQFNHKIWPICVPPKNYDVKENQRCKVAGWPVGSEKAKTTLHEVELPIVNHDVCAKNYQSDKEIKSTMICAGFIEGGGSDTCEGDSGSALMCDFDRKLVVAGVTSWGRECSKKDKPGIYTKTSSYIDWIIDVIKGNYDCNKRHGCFIKN